MANLEDTLETLVQRTGQTFNLLNGESRNRFTTALRSDMASVVNQLNNVYNPLVSSLVQIDTVDALDKGICGNTIYSNIDATINSGNIFWDSSLNRPRTIKETFDVLLTDIANLAIDAVVTSTSSEILSAVAPLSASIAANRNNLRQLKLDTVGPTYTLDNDGAADSTYPLSQHIDAIGSFFANYPGTGNSPYTNAYPTLALNVLLSQLTIDTTLAQSVITDLPTHLAAIRTFIGMGTVSETPTYSDYGAITYVVDAMSLEEAIQTLDQNVASGGSPFLTASNVTSNSPGTLATDDLVFGSDSLDDDGNSDHDARLFFDKSKGAVRAGRVTGTQWNDANRGSGSAVFGIDNIGAAATTFVSGTTNTIASTSTSSSILGGEGHDITTSTRAIILGGQNSNIEASSNAGIISCDGGAIGATGINSDNSVILGGDGQIIGATIASVGSGILGGTTSSIDGGNNNIILGGSGNVVTVNDGSVEPNNTLTFGAKSLSVNHNTLNQGGGVFPSDTSGYNGQAQIVKAILLGRVAAGASAISLTTDGSQTISASNVLYIPTLSGVSLVITYSLAFDNSPSAPAGHGGMAFHWIHRASGAVIDPLLGQPSIEISGREYNAGLGGTNQSTIKNTGYGYDDWPIELVPFGTNGGFYLEYDWARAIGGTTIDETRVVASVEMTITRIQP